MSERKQEYWERQLTGQPLRGGGFTSDIERKVRERIRMGQSTTKSRGWIKTTAAITAMAVLLGGGWLLKDDIGEFMNPSNKMAGVPASLQDDSLADMDVTLKVMENTYDNFTTMQYARPFLLHHPSVGVEAVVRPVPKEGDKLQDWIEKEKLDVLRLSFDEYVLLANEGKLLALDALIKKDKVDVNAMYEPVMDMLRTGGGGQLYGLPSDFQTYVLFVNTELFKQKGIPIPHEGMTWEELLNTAARFQGTGVTGLLPDSWAADRVYSLVDRIGSSEGLQTDVQNGKQVTVNSPAWAAIWQKVADGYREGWLYREAKKDNSVESFTPSDAFLSGKAAMVISSSYYMQQIDQVWQGDEQKQWITVPLPGISNASVYVNEIYAVRANTTNEKAAWEFAKFMTGREFAKRIIAMGGNTPIRQSDWPEGKQANIAAFYQNKFDVSEFVARSRARSTGLGKETASNTLAINAYQLGQPLMEQVIAGKLTVEQALEQLKGQLEQEVMRKKKVQP
ncbi:ABC transporter substrate-binding protein [Paenibacillus sp. MMS18-CY102]|uniref:ABC transporter substrate-binding protein n=1 Tax=Paenibacillus sp. MMS18-CY102 TaxID=2682849 RepID=UPI00136627B9|nr:extracellular solute-binding protein [Paenibacillus sp. MMS18-CY102]MWC30299.1 extracellular solute-binding protein [Paenibacillus sp. MMS18-CY102]